MCSKDLNRFHLKSAFDSLEEQLQINWVIYITKFCGVKHILADGLKDSIPLYLVVCQNWAEPLKGVKA